MNCLRIWPLLLLLLAVGVGSLATVLPAATGSAPVATNRIAATNVAAAPGPTRPVPGPNPRRGFRLLAGATLAFLCILLLLVAIAVMHSLRRH